MRPVFFDLRDGAILVEFPDASDEEANRAAIAVGARAREARVPDAVPAARSLLVRYDPERLDRDALVALVERLAQDVRGNPADAPGRTLRLPVLYDGEDLAELSAAAGLPAEELARRHAAARYRVAFVGFAPGFAYLSGLPAELAAPRLATPRPRVPAGSVAIGGAWTGFYPSASPGGWRLLGRTSALLFDPNAERPALLAPGDRVELEAVQRLDPPPPPSPPPEADGRPTFRVLSPGLFTSVQGAPRPGLGSSGVPPGGAMDLRALAAANALVGNAAQAPALEITLAGPELEVLTDTVVSSRGPVRAGQRLLLGRVERGARAYVAVAGGFVRGQPAEPTRRIAAGELLRVRAEIPGPSAFATSSGDIELPDEIRLRAVLGPEVGGFAPEQIERFFATPWRVTPESDRKGLRLAGPSLEHLGLPEIAPSGTVSGMVQVPGSGLPIVLGPDGPVTGGYPRLATVIGADLWLLGQARPGAALRFEAVTFREAASARLASRSTISLP
jgi:KipI family sensor histidine kinase inhibitor